MATAMEEEALVLEEAIVLEEIAAVLEEEAIVLEEIAAVLEEEALVPGVVETMDSIVHLVREKCISQYALTANKNVKFRSSRLKASLFIAGIVFQDIRSFRTE